MTTVAPSNRLRPSRLRHGRSHDFDLGSLSGTLTVNEMSDGRPGEVFITVAKHGSTLAGLCESLSITTSLALQHQTPVFDLVQRLLSFKPSGVTDHPEVPAAASLADYIARRLAVDYLDPHELAQLNLAPTR